MSNAKLVKELKQVYSKVPIKINVGRLREVLEKESKKLMEMKQSSSKKIDLRKSPKKLEYADTTIKSSSSQPAAIGTGEIVSTITNVTNYDKRSKLQSKIKSIKGS